ncbi:hypothetical protein CFC21_077281 [Triticum aestivum]|uniref:FBD domain-containing protein n=2 Tax=Triticum aestivum TaxID=4565 RepID=A0A3B6UBD8_WHEAT|nr:hypothetical protein CFC21_077281 [Triticum aestivum]
MELDHRVRSVRHVFGAFALHLLGMHPIRSATRKLKIIVQRSEFKEECPVNCPCDEPKSWRSKNISLINLEEVEMEGFEGEDHEFDLLKVIIRCAPTLKRLAVQMSDEGQSATAKVLRSHDSHPCVYGFTVLIDRRVLSSAEFLLAAASMNKLSR